GGIRCRTRPAEQVRGAGDEEHSRDEEAPAEEARDRRRLRPHAYRPEPMCADPRDEPAGVEQGWGEADAGGVARRVAHGGYSSRRMSLSAQPTHRPHGQKYE